MIIAVVGCPQLVIKALYVFFIWNFHKIALETQQNKQINFYLQKKKRQLIKINTLKSNQNNLASIKRKSAKNCKTFSQQCCHILHAKMSALNQFEHKLLLAFMQFLFNLMIINRNVLYQHKCLARLETHCHVFKIKDLHIHFTDH